MTCPGSLLRVCRYFKAAGFIIASVIIFNLFIGGHAHIRNMEVTRLCFLMRDILRVQSTQYDVHEDGAQSYVHIGLISDHKLPVQFSPKTAKNDRLTMTRLLGGDSTVLLVRCPVLLIRSERFDAHHILYSVLPGVSISASQ